MSDGYGFSDDQTFTVVDSVDGHKVSPRPAQNLSSSTVAVVVVVVAY